MTEKEVSNGQRKLELKDLIAFLALIVAGISLFVSINSYYQTEWVSHANLKPLLYLEYPDYVDSKGVILSNRGLGPAVITDIQFYKDGFYSKDLGDFIDSPYGAYYDTSYGFGESDGWYLKDDREIILAKITSDHLKKQKYNGNLLNDTQIEEILDAWEESIDGVRIKITYEDVLGKQQQTENDTIYM